MDVDRYLRNNMDDADYAEASAELEAYWQGAFAAGRLAGQKDMRERAAKVAESGKNEYIALYIRDLPTEE